MKSAEVMSHILSCSLSEKEMYFTVLGHVIKGERTDLLRVHSDMSEADKVGAVLAAAEPMLTRSGHHGAPKDPNSGRGLVERYLKQHGPTSKTVLRQLLMEKKGWKHSQAESNLFIAARALKLNKEGWGDEGVWSLPEAEESAA